MSENQAPYHTQHPMPAAWCAARRNEIQAWVNDTDAAPLERATYRTYLIELLAQLKQANDRLDRFDSIVKHNGMMLPELSHAQVADKVRMLSRSDLDHEMVVVLARNRIITLADKLATAEVRADTAEAKLATIRTMATRGVPNCINLTTIDRILAEQSPVVPSLSYTVLRHPDTHTIIYRQGEPIGTVQCINTARPSEAPQLRYFGKNAAGTATGQAHPTQAQAVGDVVAWADGQEVRYEQHGLRKAPVSHG